MKEQSLSIQILARMKETPNGTIYTNSDFIDLGKSDAIRKSLSRLCEAKEIFRLIDGYYTIPYFIKIVQEYSYPTADQLAKKIAEKYAWNITAYGETALNLVGLSTQVPAVCEYLSDGPYREYEYLNKKIKFKHTCNRNISKYSQSVSLIVQSIKAIGKEKITDQHIQVLAKFGKKYVEENILIETKFVPVWIYEVIKKTQEEK